MFRFGNQTNDHIKRQRKKIKKTIQNHPKAILEQTSELEYSLSQESQTEVS